MVIVSIRAAAAACALSAACVGGLATAQVESAPTPPIEIQRLDGTPAEPQRRAPPRRAAPPQSMVPPGADEQSILRTPPDILRGAAAGSTPAALSAPPLGGSGGVVLTPEFCRQLATVATPPGVSADSGAPAVLPPLVGTDLIVDPRLNSAAAAGRPLRGETVVGRVEVDPATGAAFLNGQPLGDVRAQQLAAACAQVR